MTARVTISSVDAGHRQAAGDGRWAGLLRVGGVAGLIAGLVCRRNMDAEVTLLRAAGLFGGPAAAPVGEPTGAAGWFALLQADRLVALVQLGVTDMVNYVLVAVMFLAVCAALSRRAPGSAIRPAVLLAAALTVAGVTLYLASNQAFTLLRLSDQYATASAARREVLLAAGQAALAIHANATYHGGGLYPGFLLVSAAGLTLAATMARSGPFGRRTAITGVLANLFGLAYYLARAIAPNLEALPLSISAVFLLAWYILIGTRLLRLARSGNQTDYEN